MKTTSKAQVKSLAHKWEATITADPKRGHAEDFNHQQSHNRSLATHKE